ncbi:LCP family protein [Sphaerimonospora thailandensis]|uniref:LCP family protein n=1 Tax=Sphaerimonospora thailandensis TaxID=795644 RepID=UPI00194FE43D|nr:LCP family protein [Sphaerimonospora thailandensis]
MSQTQPRPRPRRRPQQEPQQGLHQGPQQGTGQGGESRQTPQASPPRGQEQRGQRQHGQRTDGQDGQGRHGPGQRGQGRRGQGQRSPDPRQGSRSRGPGQGPAARGPRYARPLTTASLIGWTALSALVPGAAHLRAGRRRLGFGLLAAFGVVLVAIVLYGLRFTGDAGAVIRSSTLTTIMIGSGVCALAWFTLMVLSYVTLRPRRLSQNGQIVSGIVAGVLSVSVMAPFALTASAVKAVGETLDAITAPSDGSGPTPVPIRAEDPWNGRKRINFLLIGGDAAGNRESVRTDSMTVASVNLATGNTVLFSLPRNLQYVRFPPSSPLHKQFPDGFTAEQGLLNAVWYYADNNPQVMGGKNRGAQALKDAIGYTLGLKIDYYAMVDMFGFARLIDAMGGLRMRVERDIKWGGHFGTAGTIKAGYRRLTGEEVLWYGRSRVDSDDFSRMSRQRCVIGALAQQANPATVLTNFTKIAGATRHMFRTDIPRDLLEHLVPLGLKAKDAKITSLQFVPPLVWPGNPNWDKIRALTLKAIRESMTDRRTVAAKASPSGVPATAGAATPQVSANPSPSRSRLITQPTRTPTPNDDREAKGLDELCGF